MIRCNFGELTEKNQAKCLKLEHEYTWVIKNYRYCYHCLGYYDESSTFSMGRNDEYQWKLLIYSGGYTNIEYIGICPFLMNKDVHRTVKFFVEISLWNKDGQEQRTQRLTLTTENVNEANGTFQCFIRRADLLKDISLLPDGELRISCRISFDAPSTAEETVDIQYSQYYQKSQLDNFEKLYGDQELSDFKLMVGKSEFPVHQAILAARSSVFKAMFLSDMRENREKKVVIEDVAPEIITKVLLYIYSGKVREIQDVADKVFLVADKYQLDALKQICEDMLIEQLSIDNIYKMLEFSDNYNAKNLKMKGIDFFKKNFEKLAAVDDFKSTVSSLSASLQTDIICAPAKKN